jgi:hypothetical protein
MPLPSDGVLDTKASSWSVPDPMSIPDAPTVRRILPALATGPTRLLTMRFCRLASVTLSRPAPQALGRWTYTSGTGLQVRTLAPLQGAEDITDENVTERPMFNAPSVMWPRLDESTSALIVTELDGGSVEKRPDGAIQLDQNARRSAEQALVDYADLLAVYFQCRRLLRSPSPCLALKPESDDESELLRRSRVLLPRARRSDAPYCVRNSGRRPICGSSATGLTVLLYWPTRSPRNQRLAAYEICFVYWSVPSQWGHIVRLIRYLRFCIAAQRTCPTIEMRLRTG